MTHFFLETTTKNWFILFKILFDFSFKVLNAQIFQHMTPTNVTWVVKYSMLAMKLKVISYQVVVWTVNVENMKRQLKSIALILNVPNYLKISNQTAYHYMIIWSNVVKPLKYAVNNNYIIINLLQSFYLFLVCFFSIQK